MEDIIENNKLIAEFMGVADSPYYYIPEHQIDIFDENNNWIEKSSHFQANELKYHSSWDWLLPVVEKIELFDEVSSFNISTTEIFIEMNVGDDISHICWENTSKLQVTYITVVEFIKWYNQQKI